MSQGYQKKRVSPKSEMLIRVTNIKTLANAILSRHVVRFTSCARKTVNRIFSAFGRCLLRCFHGRRVALVYPAELAAEVRIIEMISNCQQRLAESKQFPGLHLFYLKGIFAWVWWNCFLHRFLSGFVFCWVILKSTRPLANKAHSRRSHLFVFFVLTSPSHTSSHQSACCFVAWTFDDSFSDCNQGSLCFWVAHSNCPLLDTDHRTSSPSHPPPL